MFENVLNKVFCGAPVLNFDINGCFFSIESVFCEGILGGGIEIAFNLLLNGALEGELDAWWAAFDGDCLVGPVCGGLSMIFLLDAAFLIGLSGDIFLRFELFFEDGIGAWSNDVTGSW